MHDRLSHFFSKFFGVSTKHENLKNATFPTFEEALGVLEIALKREESFKGFRQSSTKPQVALIREDLIFLIALVLAETLRNIKGLHRQLLQRLDHSGQLIKTNLISLNYDIIMDNAIIRQYPIYDLDYGVEFTNFKRKDNWKRPRPRKSIQLYKPHGSLNWLYCPACISLTLTEKKDAATLVFKPQKCEACDTEMIPIIIPPTFFKSISNYYLQEVWHRTEKVLKKAKRIFFCGYSFPDADIHMKYILKRVELDRNTSPEIWIINDDKDKNDEQREREKASYIRFFKNKEKVHYTHQSFKKFCKKGVE